MLFFSSIIDPAIVGALNDVKIILTEICITIVSELPISMVESILCGALRKDPRGILFKSSQKLQRDVHRHHEVAFSSSVCINIRRMKLPTVASMEILT